MLIQDEIIKQQQRVARLEQNLALQKIKQRKADTRRKIEFGGLVVKANMAGYSKAVILGALLDAAQQLEEGSDTKRLFQLKGEAAFMDFDK